LRWRVEDLEEGCCDLCGSRSHHVVFTRPDGLNAVECNECGLCFLCPRPRAALIGTFYDRSYFTEAGPSNGYGYVDYGTPGGRFEMLRNAKQRLALLERYVNPKGKRCLEVGCGTGEFCYVLSHAGASPCGVDLSEYAIRKARGRYQSLDFRVASLTSVPTEEQFDAVVAFELIEHVISPKLLFESVRGRLRRGGVLLLTTPNYECAKRVGADNWCGFSLSFEHLYFFTLATLSRYGEAAGMRALGCLSGGGNGRISDHQEVARRRSRRRLRNEALGRLLRVKAIEHLLAAWPVEGHGYVGGDQYHNLLLAFEAR
jgi:SAM-dependent methyltransferase